MFQYSWVIHSLSIALEDTLKCKKTAVEPGKWLNSMQKHHLIINIHLWVISNCAYRIGETSKCRVKVNKIMYLIVWHKWQLYFYMIEYLLDFYTIEYLHLKVITKISTIRPEKKSNFHTFVLSACYWQTFQLFIINKYFFISARKCLTIAI